MSKVQIRIFVPEEYYRKLKIDSKKAGIPLNRWAGLLLSGYKVVPPVPPSEK